MLHRSPDARQGPNPVSEHSDPVGSLEVGEHQDVEEFGAGSGAPRVDAPLESALKSSSGRTVRA